MRQNENDQKNEGFSSAQSQQALQSLKSLSVEPSPFLKTRVLAHAREQRQSKISFFKKYFLIPSITAALAILVSISYLQKKDSAVPTYAMGKDYVIRMDIRPFKDEPIAYAEIVLDDENVQFSSIKFSEISAQKKMTVSWENLVEKQFLPIVIKGLKAGSSKVVVNFYDANNNLVKTQDVNLKFKAGT